MNRPLRILTVAALGLIAGCAARDNKYERDLIGTWYSQGQDPSLTWKLEKDGDYGQATGFVTPDADQGSWRYDRGELITATRENGKKVEHRAKARVVGNTMTVEMNGQVFIFTRIGQ